jgi:hypothetical protein
MRRRIEWAAEWRLRYPGASVETMIDGYGLSVERGLLMLLGRSVCAKPIGAMEGDEWLAAEALEILGLSGAQWAREIVEALSRGPEAFRNYIGSVAARAVAEFRAVIVATAPPTERQASAASVTCVREWAAAASARARRILTSRRASPEAKAAASRLLVESEGRRTSGGKKAAGGTKP